MKKILLSIATIGFLSSNLFASGQYYYKEKKQFKDLYLNGGIELNKITGISDLTFIGTVSSEKKYYIEPESPISIGVNPFIKVGYQASKYALIFGANPSINYDIDSNFRLSGLTGFDYVIYDNIKNSSTSYTANIGLAGTWATHSNELTLSYKRLYTKGTVYSRLYRNGDNKVTYNSFEVNDRFFLGENLYLYGSFKYMKPTNKNLNTIKNFSVGLGFPFWK